MSRLNPPLLPTTWQCRSDMHEECSGYHETAQKGCGCKCHPRSKPRLSLEEWGMIIPLVALGLLVLIWLFGK